MLHQGPLVLDAHRTYLLWQRLAQHGCDAMGFAELTALLRHESGGRRVLQDTATYLRREATKKTLEYIVDKISLPGGKDQKASANPASITENVRVK